MLMDSLQDCHHFEELYHFIFGADRSVDIAAVLRKEYNSEANRKRLKALSEEDMSASEIKLREREYLTGPSFEGTNKEAVARKLAVMAELNSSFVTDRRLWK